MKTKKKIKLNFYFLILISFLTILFIYKNYGLVFFEFQNNEPVHQKKLYVKNYNSKAEFMPKISIRNGCGKTKLGLIYKRYLLDIGYDVTETDNADHFGYELTTILFHKNNKNSAEYLAHKLGINAKELVEETNLKNYHDLTLILGQNYNNLKSYKIAEKYNPFK